MVICLANYHAIGHCLCCTISHCTYCIYSSLFILTCLCSSVVSLLAIEKWFPFSPFSPLSHILILFVCPFVCASLYSSLSQSFLISFCFLLSLSLALFLIFMNLILYALYYFSHICSYHPSLFSAFLLSSIIFTSLPFLSVLQCMRQVR